MGALPINWGSLFPPGAFAGVPVLVTGGAGFIGSHLAGALVELGAKVTVLDDLVPGAGSSEGNVPRGATFRRGSILDGAALREAARECRYVFHLAALGSVPRSVEQPAAYVETNVTGTLAVLEAARHAGVQRVMFAASSSAYGDTEMLPKHEEMPPRPLSPYAATKVAGEALCRAYAGSYSVDTVSLRYFNIFGPRQSAESAYAAVIAAFAKALLTGERPTIFGDGSQSRDFTHVSNAVYANLLSAVHPGRLGGEVFNVATGGRVTVLELATRLAALLGRPDLFPRFAPPRPGDVLHSQASLAKVQAGLGYRPLAELDDGLADTLAWYRGKPAAAR